jgi:two-component system, OmpR family, alkaline phosphatase synthesis response regulator PhoP
MQARVLLVEDEKHIREAIRLNLEMDGYEVVATDKGTDALKHFSEQNFHLVILDIMLPEMDGFYICEQMRLQNDEVPILFLTAKDSSEDKVKGLKKGADDYITKPFHLEEFLLRVKSLVKRGMRNTPDGKDLHIFRFGENEVNFHNFKALGPKGEVDLTKKEAALLKLLVEREGEVVSRNEILKLVWGYDVYPSTRTIDNFILHFRKIFEPDTREPIYFHAVRGVGYKFTAS